MCVGAHKRQRERQCELFKWNCVAMLFVSVQKHVVLINTCCSLSRELFRKELKKLLCANGAGHTLKCCRLLLDLNKSQNSCKAWKNLPSNGNSHWYYQRGSTVLDYSGGTEKKPLTTQAKINTVIIIKHNNNKRSDEASQNTAEPRLDARNCTLNNKTTSQLLI